MSKPWDNFFVPEDFEGHVASDYGQKNAASAANAKLAREVEKWPVVYGAGDDTHPAYSNLLLDLDTHTARLAFIQPIVREPCKHEPEQVFITTHTDHSGFVTHLSAGFKCSRCGAKLKRTEVWSAE